MEIYSNTSENNLYTIGYGNRKIDDFFALLTKYGIQFLIDVRSFPYSKINPNYNKDPLSAVSKKHNIKYAFWGDSLGGKPRKEELYLDSGKVDYQKLEVQTEFKKSINRLVSAYNQGFKVGLMCSEQKPEECHRTKLIGESLMEKHLKISHIDEKGNLRPQEEVMLRVTKGVNTTDLFGNKSLSSIGTYSDVIKTDFDFFTIGVYNSTENDFFQKLSKNSIDTFVDIRQRRGVRGAKYAYVNSNRLQGKLEELGINYLYFKDLAPTSEVRELQKETDIKAGIQKRNREYLGQTFIREYQSRVLDNFDFSHFFDALNKLHSKRIVFFCVEEKHTACHRSIVTSNLEEKFNYHSKNL